MNLKQLFIPIIFWRQRCHTTPSSHTSHPCHSSHAHSNHWRWVHFCCSTSHWPHWVCGCCWSTVMISEIVTTILSHCRQWRRGCWWRWSALITRRYIVVGWVIDSCISTVGPCRWRLMLGLRCWLLFVWLRLWIMMVLLVGLSTGWIVSAAAFLRSWCWRRKSVGMRRTTSSMRIIMMICSLLVPVLMICSRSCGLL